MTTYYFCTLQPKGGSLFCMYVYKVYWHLTAICLIRAVTAVKYQVTLLCPVVAGPVSTPQLRTLGVI